MHPRDAEPVAGHADEAHEALVARLERRLERAALAQGGLPLDRVDQVVQLDQVDVVDSQPLQRAPDPLAGARAVARPVFVATKNSSGYRLSQGASRSSASP